MKINLGVIGHFGGSEEFIDGQTIKTKNVTNLLENQPNVYISKVDTYYYKKNKFKLIIELILCLIKCKYIILMVSVNGMRVLLPLLYFLNKFFRKHIYHYVIGSELLEMVSRDSNLIIYLNAMEANWFEYESGTKYLQGKGVTNVLTVPNFKELTPVQTATSYISEDGIYRYCTFSRVMKEKGITQAVKAIRKINLKRGCKVAHLDIYGPIEPNYEMEFKQLIDEHVEDISYRGTVISTQSVEKLKDYYAMLFPTYWVGEGVPGTIIDSFAAGIPVIATDWNANKEIIYNMKQGILYPCGDINSLEDAIEWSLNNEDKMNQMRIESRKEFIKYMPETILDIVIREFNKYN